MSEIEKQILFCEKELEKIDSILKESEHLRFTILLIFRLDLLLFFINVKMMRKRIIKKRDKVIKVIEIIKEMENATRL
jgi:hypothetical protein